MAVYTKLPDLLRAAQAACENPALIPSHLGYIDRALREILTDCRLVLPVAESILLDPEFAARTRSEIASIEDALTVYAPTTRPSATPGDGADTYRLLPHRA